MRASQALFGVFLTIGLATAATYSWYGGFSAWSVYYLASGKGVMEKAFTTCKERYNDGPQTANGYVCMWHLTSFIFESFLASFTGGYAVDTVTSGSGNAKESSGSTPPGGRFRRDDIVTRERDTRLLDRFNGNLAGSGFRGTHVVPSHVHLSDGFAVRTNVRGNGTTLHIHTNGTHAMSLFDQDDSLNKRDFLDTDNHYYTFDGIWGLKAQAHLINAPHNSDYTSDADKFAKHFAASNLRSEPIMEDHDSWSFEVCNKKKTATFFYGKIIAEASQPAGNYEAMDPPGCS